jgi:hypothetical protein
MTMINSNKSVAEIIKEMDDAFTLQRETELVKLAFENDKGAIDELVRWATPCSDSC